MLLNLPSEGVASLLFRHEVDVLFVPFFDTLRVDGVRRSSPSNLKISFLRTPSLERGLLQPPELCNSDQQSTCFRQKPQ